MVSGLSGVWFFLFLQRILMSRLPPAIRPSTGQSSESLPSSSLGFLGLPWPGLPSSVWSSLVFPRAPWPSLASLVIAFLFVLSFVVHAIRVSNHAIRVVSRTRATAVSTRRVVLVFPLVLLAHEEPFLGQLQNNGTGGGARRALNKLKPHRLHKEL